MKKLVILIGSMMLLSACNVDSFFEKEKGNVQQEGSSKNEQQTPGKEDIENNQTAENSQTTEPQENKLTLESKYFNEILEVDNKKIIQNPTNLMVLVNLEFSLSEQYIPEDIVSSNVTYQALEKSFLRKEAAEALEEMFADASNNGIELIAISGYRSYARQKEVFDAQVSTSGYEEAAKLVAIPGNSEHQTGLAMDISSRSVNLDLVEQFEETPEGKWLKDNAHRFGFILRYPKGKEGITGYNFEPWHFRYVGIKAATEIYENDLTLEEYFNIVEKI